MAWYIVPYNFDGIIGVFPSRTLAINPYLLKFSGVTIDVFEEVEVRGNRAIVRVEGAINKYLQLDSLFYRLPDNLGDGLNEGDTLALNAELLSMGYAQADIDAAFPDGLGKITLKEYINFAQSQLFAIVYDEKQNTLIEDLGQPRTEWKPKDPQEVDDRVLAGKV